MRNFLILKNDIRSPINLNRNIKLIRTASWPHRIIKNLRDVLTNSSSGPTASFYMRKKMKLREKIMLNV